LQLEISSRQKLKTILAFIILDVVFMIFWINIQNKVPINDDARGTTHEANQIEFEAGMQHMGMWQNK
jgi:hypothetical protein